MVVFIACQDSHAGEIFAGFVNGNPVSREVVIYDGAKVSKDCVENANRCLALQGYKLHPEKYKEIRRLAVDPAHDHCAAIRQRPMILFNQKNSSLIFAYLLTGR